MILPSLASQHGADSVEVPKVPCQLLPLGLLTLCFRKLSDKY